jgi:F-type H+-transporting ATPase subunit epsilon
MFNLVILTLEKTVFDEEVFSVNVPGSEGYFEILSNHAPLIALIKPGKLEIQKHEGSKLIYALSGGFFEVSDNNATLIADAIELVSEIDVKRAQLALEKALERLESGEKEIDIHRAKEAAARANNRLKIYHDYHHQ